MKPFRGLVETLRPGLLLGVVGGGFSRWLGSRWGLKGGRLVTPVRKDFRKRKNPLEHLRWPNQPPVTPPNYTLISTFRLTVALRPGIPVVFADTTAPAASVFVNPAQAAMMPGPERERLLTTVTSRSLAPGPSGRHERERLLTIGPSLERGKLVVTGPSVERERQSTMGPGFERERLFAAESSLERERLLTMGPPAGLERERLLTERLLRQVWAAFVLPGRHIMEVRRRASREQSWSVIFGRGGLQLAGAFWNALTVLAGSRGPRGAGAVGAGPATLGNRPGANERWSQFFNAQTRLFNLEPRFFNGRTQFFDGGAAQFFNETAASPALFQYNALSRIVPPSRLNLFLRSLFVMSEKAGHALLRRNATRHTRNGQSVTHKSWPSTSSWSFINSWFSTQLGESAQPTRAGDGAMTRSSWSFINSWPSINSSLSVNSWAALGSWLSTLLGEGPQPMGGGEGAVSFASWSSIRSSSSIRLLPFIRSWPTMLLRHTGPSTGPVSPSGSFTSIQLTFAAPQAGQGEAATPPASRFGSSPPMHYVRQSATLVRGVANALRELRQSFSDVKVQAPAPPPQIDYLTRQVYDQLKRELRIEKERRGL